MHGLFSIDDGAGLATAGTQLLLHDLHQLVLRAKTYVDDQLTEEVSL